LAFDLIVDPPSNSGYHRSFLSACHNRIGLAKRMIRFVKETHLSSSPQNIAALRQHWFDIESRPGAGMTIFVNIPLGDGQ
jgi:hypothetical protein